MVLLGSAFGKDILCKIQVFLDLNLLPAEFFFSDVSPEVSHTIKVTIFKPKLVKKIEKHVNSIHANNVSKGDVYYCYDLLNYYLTFKI